MIKIICFDLWETLVTEPSSFEDCWQPFVKAHPEKVDWKKIKTLIAQIAQRKDQSTQESTREILKELGVADELLVAEISGRWEDSCDKVTLFPETIEALKGLKAAGFKLGLITNTSVYGWEAVQKKLALGGYFDYLALSFKIGHIKPEPEIFGFMESESGFSASEITMVGDSYKSDFKPPRERGWGSVLLDRMKLNEHPDAKPAINDLLQLKEIL